MEPTTHDRPTLSICALLIHCNVSMGAGSLMVWLYALKRSYMSLIPICWHISLFVSLCQGICCAGVNSCCQLYTVCLCIEQSIPQCAHLLLYICGSWWPYGLVIFLYAEGHGYDSCDDTFPDFFLLELCHAGVDLCCLSLIVTIWLGKLFFLSYSIDLYQVFNPLCD